MDGKAGREVTFDPTEFRQLDHGYAVTSHSSQGLTADRMIANIDTDSSRSLINDRLAYVGYAIESTKRLAVDRVILSGEPEQIAAQREPLSQLPANLHELTVYTSDGYQVASPELAVQKEIVGPVVAEIPTPDIDAPSIEFEGYAIEL